MAVAVLSGGLVLLFARARISCRKRRGLRCRQSRAMAERYSLAGERPQRRDPSCPRVRRCPSGQLRRALGRGRLCRRDRIRRGTLPGIEYAGAGLCRDHNGDWGSPSLGEFCTSYPRTVAFPIAVGIAGADHGIALPLILHAYIHAFTANLVSAAVRLIPLGHTDGQRALMLSESAVASAVAQGGSGDLSQLSNAVILSDIASILHETQNARLFRS